MDHQDGGKDKGAWAPEYLQSGTEAPWYRGWDISEEERERYRKISLASKEARKQAYSADAQPVRPINEPKLKPTDLMPQRERHGLRALSLFSGGGGLDIGFDRAGYTHVASYEVLDFAAETIKANRPDWTIHGGRDGDVTAVDWTKLRGTVDVVHGGPPCQPFSIAGRRKGQQDARDMFPELVRCVREIQPLAFVAENVPGLAAKKFEPHVQQTIVQPLSDLYVVHQFTMAAPAFGVPQDRKRVFWVGIHKDAGAADFAPPQPTHDWLHLSTRKKLQPRIDDDAPVLPKTMGAREALGLPSVGHDTVAPTIRSTLTGPRHTTSIVNSVAAVKRWEEIQIWPNGVAASRHLASRFAARNGHFRLSVHDCKVLQGFPEEWAFEGPVYKVLGQIGNSVAPPVGYHVATALYEALVR